MQALYYMVYIRGVCSLGFRVPKQRFTTTRLRTAAQVWVLAKLTRQAVLSPKPNHKTSYNLKL